MLKEVEVIDEGFEEVVAVYKSSINAIEDAKAEEIKNAIDEINTKYGSRLDRYKEELARLCHTETIEVEDECNNTDCVDCIEAEPVEENLPKVDAIIV